MKAYKSTLMTKYGKIPCNVTVGDLGSDRTWFVSNLYICRISINTNTLHEFSIQLICSYDEINSTLLNVRRKMKKLINECENGALNGKIFCGDISKMSTEQFINFCKYEYT